MTENPPAFLTVKELADLLRLKERKVYDLAARGDVPCSRATGKLLFPRHEINAWIAGHSTGGAQALPARPGIFLGSHDPLLEWAIRDSRCDLAVFFDGSLDGLTRFCTRDGIACGLHLYDAATQGWNVPHVAAACAGQNAVLIHFATRTRGLILRPGLTALRGIADIAGRCFAPRQPESGSDALFRHLAAEAGLDLTHLEQATMARSEIEAAQAVARGQADVSFGLEAVARDFGLRFVPVIEESFDLLVDRKAWFAPQMQTLWRFCQSDPFQARAALMRGYRLDGLGEVRWNG